MIRIFLGFSILLATQIVASASLNSLHGYPEKERPAISALEASQMVQEMLKLRGDSDRLYILEVSICGAKKGPEEGLWTILLCDKDGNKAIANIPFPEFPGIAYYVRLDYFPKDKRRTDERVTVHFTRKEGKLIVSGVGKNNDPDPE